MRKNALTSRAFLVGLVALSTSVAGSSLSFEARAATRVNALEKTTLSLQGNGAVPNADVMLSTGGAQTLTAKADKSGAFSFANLVYVPSAPLSFNLSLPVPSGKSATDKGSDRIFNSLRMELDPYISTATVSGTISKAGSVVVNLAGEDSKTAVASHKGYFELQAFPSLSRDTTKTPSKLIASIINVTEDCCPRSFVPVTPVTLTIQSEMPTTDESALPATSPKAVPVKPSTPLLVVPQKTKENKNSPAEKKLAPKNAPPKNKYLVIPGSVSYETTTQTKDLAFAIGQAEFDATWTGGLKGMTADLIEALVHQTEIIGTFFDVRNNLAAQRMQQVMASRTLKDYQTSESLCRFGTLSRSLAASDSMVNVHKIAFSEILQDRDLARRASMYARSGGEGFSARIANFRTKYCDPADNNNSLWKFCDSLAAAQNRMNFDLDYTRMIDTPLTIKANFTDGATNSSEEDMIALLQNISLSAAMENLSPEKMKMQETQDNIQDLHAIISARGIARNSFISLVSQKMEGKAGSAQYMKALLQEMGIAAADVDTLIGTNPSYYAQMEVLTKKIYQDPDFIANLYDTPTNVNRQRASMKAINLQQSWDLAETIRRRELLLSTLLELKLRNLQATEDIRGSSLQ
jgi:hypothetical protein